MKVNFFYLLKENFFSTITNLTTPIYASSQANTSALVSMCEFVFYRVYIFHAMYAVLAHQYRYNYRSITTLFLVVCTSTLSSGSTFKIGCSFLSIPSNVFNSPNLAFFSVIHPKVAYHFYFLFHRF